MTAESAVLVLQILALIVCRTASQVTVSLLDTAILVNEGQQFDLRVQKTGSISSVVNVIVQVKSPVDTDNDFFGSSQVGSFYPQGPDIIPLTFTVNDDSDPEVEETFTFQLLVLNDDVSVATPNIAAVTITANDDAYGVFRFIDKSPVIVTEDSITTVTYLRVAREKGTKGQVTVTYQVNGTTESSLPGADVTPRTGIIVFQDGETQNYLQLQIRSDDIPENNEEFIVQLTGASYGARVLDTEMILIILANDAPLRFQQHEYRFEENTENSVFSIPVLRGIDEDGFTRIGSINSVASVNYFVMSDTASAGIDFLNVNGQIVFSPGETTKDLELRIIDDTIPEVEEQFEVRLSDEQGDVILTYPTKVLIKINANDNPFGVISFSSLDQNSPPILRVNEDSVRNVTFAVVRDRGTFGTVSVSWRVYRNDTSTGEVSRDIITSSGVIIFQSGIDKSSLTITVVDDVIPEPTEKYRVQLMAGTETGGAEVQGISYGILLIEDSDNYYGIVEFGVEAEQQIIVTTSPRNVQLNFRRNGNNHGDILLNITLLYFGSASTADILETSITNVIIPATRNSQIERVPIKASAFLHAEDYFQASITALSLLEDAPLGYFNTPKLGSRVQVKIPVTIAVANGEIGFSNVQAVIVTEPDVSPLSVFLNISREGTSGQATVLWLLKGSGENADMVTDGDTLYKSGQVIMEAGSSEATVILTIMPDDVPEIEEEMTVSLISATPSDTQRLKTGATDIKVIIEENDNPGGIFEFSSSMKNIYEVQEGSSAIEVIVERSGGNLLHQSVQYAVTPRGNEEFYGATNVLTFAKGISSSTSFLIAIEDGKPELLEEYTLSLQAYGNSTAVIGPRSAISIKVLANEDPYGLIEFLDEQPVYYLNESISRERTSANIPVIRRKGTFGNISISWTVNPNHGEDLVPASGTLNFEEGQDTGYLFIETVLDDISESQENFTIELVVNGEKGRLGSRNSAFVIIPANDFRLYYRGRFRRDVLSGALYHFDDKLTTNEPSIVQLTVVREGPGTDQATLQYRTLDGTATAGSGDYIDQGQKEIVFYPGEFVKVIEIVILQDESPEGNETFYVQIFELRGDIILYNNSVAEVTILANDNAYGIFKFLPPYEKESQEGYEVSFDVGRNGGRFGVVDVYWEIIDKYTGQVLSSGGDFVTANGTVTFNPGDYNHRIYIQPRADLVPEKDKDYKLRISGLKIVEGLNDSQLASLDDPYTEVTITVKASDDPYGRFAFSKRTENLVISEDFYPGGESNTRAVYIVERRQGFFGDVQVAWEVFSAAFSKNLPNIYDLMFLADGKEKVTLMPTMRRTNTGTDVVYLTGDSDMFLRVDTTLQPPPSELQNGFTISIWIQPVAFTSSYLIAKTTNGGSRMFYALKLTTSTTVSVLHFGFSTTGSNENNEVSVTKPSNLQDGLWHHVATTVESNTINFYLDGILIGAKKTSGQSLIDSTGTLLIGAISPGKDRFIGYMQDARLFSRALSNSEIQEQYLGTVSEDITPISGYISYKEGQGENNITITSVQDTIEENDEVFSVVLIGAKNGAQLAKSDSVTALTVLKSDFANGVFGFSSSSACYPSVSVTESELITCEVTRSRGTFGAINITWEVTYTGTQTIASADFETSSGYVAFESGDRAKPFTLKVKDDTLPEPQELFQIKLVGVSSNDGVLGSTNTSGGSINASAAVFSLIVEKNDNANGLLQFSNATAPPQPGQGIIQSADERPTIRLTEEGGTFNILVVRAMGTMGSVSAEWRTSDGTAKSSNKQPPDYEAAAGTVTFIDGQLYEYISVRILDNNIPEDDKTFYINLFNPTNGAAVGLGSSVAVVIEHSDNAYGIFQFPIESLSKEVVETGDSGYTTANIKVVRTEGIIGTAKVGWEILGNPENDFVTSRGNVTFLHGETESNIVIFVRGDTLPELDKTFILVLKEVTKGSLAGSNLIRCNVTILANDHPYGVFYLSSDQRPIQIDESTKNVSVQIERKYGAFGTVDVYYRSLAESETFPYLPLQISRANGNDFKQSQGFVRFGNGQTTGTFNVLIRDDTEPENDESVFVVLTNLQLVFPAQIKPVDDSPILEQASETYGEIIILKNDNAHGSLELSPTFIYVEENSTEVGIKVVRRDGTFGQVSVTVRIINGTALQNLDVASISSTVVLGEGEPVKTLPIRLIDDDIPEQMETFYIQLETPVSGGAILGASTYATINILPSDDPMGAFEFSLPGMSVEEGDVNNTVNANIRVIRRGGSMGVVSLDWVATLDGSEASNDVSPTSGKLYFLSNEASRNIIISVLPDDEPEGTENITITLLRASNGARIGGQYQFTLAIGPNDNPHGIVQFTMQKYQVMEDLTDTVQYISLSRMGGRVGQLKVSYNTLQKDFETFNISEILSYFQSPVSGRRGTVGQTVDISRAESPLKGCAVACLDTEACIEFELSTINNINLCIMFADPANGGLIPSPAHQYYTKNQTKLQEIQRGMAKAGEDFQMIESGYVLLNDNADTGSIPVTILADNHPEIDESFMVQLTNVEVISPGASDKFPPTLGPYTNATVTISGNDDAYGVLRIFSDSPRASDDGLLLPIEEKQQYAVDLVVERQGGSLGDVSVDWYIDTTLSNATKGADFNADGATLRFPTGITRRMITVTILNDEVPEMNETLSVGLQNPIGGVGLSSTSAMTIIILENDNVAGIVGFNTTALLCKEGDTVSFFVARKRSALGSITVDWNIRTLSNSNPVNEFLVHSGSLSFLPGETSKSIQLTVKVDDKPEANEEYQVHLTNIQTFGVGDTGRAIIDPQFQYATLTIQGSNNPYGVIQFAEASRSVRIEEKNGNGTVMLHIERKYGAIDAIRVVYNVTEAMQTDVRPNLLQATAGYDFNATQGYVDMADGSASAAIDIHINDDDLPEIDEVFIVKLTNVYRLDEPNSANAPPKLDDTDIISYIIISANDGAKGVISFSPESENVYVDEIAKNISLAIRRTEGTFGNVSVFCYARSIVPGTTQGSDFIFEPREIAFANGEERKMIMIQILDDDIPEPDEKLQIILENPRSGVDLGNAVRANITIVANDGSSGLVEFVSNGSVSTNERLTDTLPQQKVRLSVKRGPGIFGVVNVPFRVIPENPVNENDLTPMQSYVTFQDGQVNATVEITVLDDTIPEYEEKFMVQLLEPDGGARLGTITQKIIIVLSNDSPNGAFQISASNTRNTTLYVEENIGLLTFNVERYQGLDGLVTVDITTVPGTATANADLSSVSLIPIEIMNSNQVKKWYNFVIDGTDYILMLTHHRVGDLETSVGSDGSVKSAILERYFHTTLFKWQGQLVPIQTIETDAATSAVAFTVNNGSFLVITNMGNVHRYETKSRMYKINENGTLLVIQDIATKGAADVQYFSKGNESFVVFSNSKDNNGGTLVEIQIFRFLDSSKMLSPFAWQSLENPGASAISIFNIDEDIYIAVANNYDSRTKSYNVDSVIYKLGNDLKLSTYQRIPTNGAKSVVHLENKNIHILMFGNNRDASLNSPQTSGIYLWDSTSKLFLIHKSIETNRVENLAAFLSSDETAYIAISNAIGQSKIYAWNVQTQSFTTVWNGPASICIQPITISQESGPLLLLAVAEVNSQFNATLYQFVKIKDSDYSPRTITLTFEGNTTLRKTSVMVLQDDQPEETETFYVTLSNPTRGAEVGPQNTITVNILSNDDAHGIIEISADSREIVVQEEENKDSYVQINVVRTKGFFGSIVVNWKATSDQSVLLDISPIAGQTEFASGQSVATITLTILNDNLPEPAEVTYITLTEISESGSSLDGRGAIIGSNNAAKIIVQASDSPYGVVSWEKRSFIVNESDTSDETHVFYIVREQGLEGRLRVSYQTSSDLGIDQSARAVSGEDYVAKQSIVIMQENVSKVPIEIVIKKDTTPEAEEKFIINITDVQLLDKSPSNGAAPSVKIPGNIISVVIAENDGIRGIVQFSENLNIEGRVDVYEEYNKNTTISLRVSRTIGLLGDVTVTWQADPREATVLDFKPLSGTISLADGEEHAYINITVLDDAFSEDMETFDVKLISVINGRSELGTRKTVRVAILKNDSPTGVFFLKEKEVTVQESQNNVDPRGEVSLTVERRQGTDGVVRVHWRMSADAVHDFEEPLNGIITFREGELVKLINLRTKVDSIIEGEETFSVSLIMADNNADISPTDSYAKVTILADPGAKGSVSILSQSRLVLIGEPGESDFSYDGQEEVTLTRGSGIFGEIAVTWSLVPRDNEAFLQFEGVVQFADLQQTANITLQALDDSIPELRTTYTLQITSASNGATISRDPNLNTASVVFVASDHPHGLFAFQLPQIQSVLEDDDTISVPVVRTYGTNGVVLVTYSTHQGTAQQYRDYFPSANILSFHEGESVKFIQIRMIPDDIPEGPEYFYINLTSCRLETPSINNYSDVFGLTLDARPVIGSVDVKTILINKNDDAEGLVEFKESMNSLRVDEEVGIAQIVLWRRGGTYGDLIVSYVVENGTAVPDNDYVSTSSEVIIKDGQSNTTIDITIIDDPEMESDENFQIRLTDVSGGARLGDNLLTTVTIIKSDFPNGLFGFTGKLNIVLDNPERPTQQELTVGRTGGLTGQQVVHWRIMGPNNPNRELQETNDIAFIPGRLEQTKGNITWNDGDGGEKTIMLQIKAFTSWEVEETFVIEIYQVLALPREAGDGEIAATGGRTYLTIKKFGFPNGNITFVGVARSEREVDEPTGVDTAEIRFPISRKAGTGSVGTIMVFWELHGPLDPLTPDVQPLNGSVIMVDGQRDTEIVLYVLPDSVPELNELFRVVLTSTEGGADIDLSFNESTFSIKFNDHPHGVFGLNPIYQKIVVDPATLQRNVQLNFTRYYGGFGNVIVTFSIRYDKSQSGIALRESGGSIGFEQGVHNVMYSIPIVGDGFLEKDSTFTATLSQVQYLGAGVTEPPSFKMGETVVNIVVPQSAANSEVGFEYSTGSINETSNTAVVTLTRSGVYGAISVSWRSGFPENEVPTGFVEGLISPEIGTVTMSHGEETKSVIVSVTPNLGSPELFALRIVTAQPSSGSGTVRLSPMMIHKLEPHGVIGFSQNSTVRKVSEMDGKIYLHVQRMYGSEGKIEITYQVHEKSAVKDIDYVATKTNTIVIESGQSSGILSIEVLQDFLPEEQEVFNVNLTYVEKFPTELTPGISPRLSSVRSGSIIQIAESNDPYGVLYLEPSEKFVTEQFQQINLTIARFGGTYGTISVQIRTVGGGEEWTSQIASLGGTNKNDTITDILSNRDINSQGTGGLDYEVLDKRIVFNQGELKKSVLVTVLSDDIAEPDETIILYLTRPTGGARIAEGSRDAGKKGFSVITVLQNDMSNGLVGFSDASKFVTVNEDSSPVVSLSLIRTNADFGEVKVSWVAKVREDSTAEEDASLITQLVRTSGTAIIPAFQRSSSFNLSLINDQIPEEQDSFVVTLVNAKPDSQLIETGRTAVVTVEPSDYVRGMFEFVEDSRILIVGDSETSVRLAVQREKGQNYRVGVTYETSQMRSQVQFYGVSISPALDGEDFLYSGDTLIFEENEEGMKYIDVKLTPRSAFDNPIPKQFYVMLKNPTNGSELHSDVTFHRAVVRIVNDHNKELWEAIKDLNDVSFNSDYNILRILAVFDGLANENLDETKIKLIQNILKAILNEGQNRPLSAEVLEQLFNILCNLLNPMKNDASRGRSDLVTLMEMLAYAKLSGTPCPSPEGTDLHDMQCSYAKVNVGRWPLQRIQSFQYTAQRADSFTVPSKLQIKVPGNTDCHDFFVIEYSSEQWFTSEPVLLSNKIMAFEVKGGQSGYTASPAKFKIHSPYGQRPSKHAQCVYYDFVSNTWMNPQGTCQVVSDISLGLDNLVECSCNHLTNYAVKAALDTPEPSAYNALFYVACFFCMIGMALTVVAHHFATATSATFTANLLMHYCFACCATQLCYLVAAYTSPSDILVFTTGEDNYRCIIMGLFMHYFFLSQFTWILAEGINLWKILVMNDEHTERMYVFYFCLGWASPIAVLAIFYVVAYSLYQHVYNIPADFIYGDINNRGEMCFITNPYAALGGVIVPVLLVLVTIGVIFVKAFQITPQWQAYDDIYRGRYNINEIRTLLSFWAVMIFTWLWGGLHMAYAQTWMLIIFSIFNILQGILAVVLYTLLRNPCLQQCFGKQRDAYYMSNIGLFENGQSPQPSLEDINSQNNSRISVSQKWDGESTFSSKYPTINVKRALPASGNIYVSPSILVQSSKWNDGDEDFNDLLYALKDKQFFSENDVISLDSDKMSDLSNTINKFEMRRISIADTHL